MSDTSKNDDNNDVLRRIFSGSIDTFLTGSKQPTTARDIEGALANTFRDLVVLGKISASKVPFIYVTETSKDKRKREFNIEFFDTPTGELIKNLSDYLGYSRPPTFIGCDVIVTIDGKEIKGIDSNDFTFDVPGDLTARGRDKVKTDIEARLKPNQEA